MLVDESTGSRSPEVAVNELVKTLYWHRELPPLGAEALGEHTLEAASVRVPDTIARRDELWERCTDDLQARIDDRLHAEIRRLGGRYAHVLNESIDTKHDASTGEAWLHGQFTYVLYR
jgi:hypothetical protein